MLLANRISWHASPFTGRLLNLATQNLDAPLPVSQQNPVESSNDRAWPIKFRFLQHEKVPCVSGYRVSSIPMRYFERTPDTLLKKSSDNPSETGCDQFTFFNSSRSDLAFIALVVETTYKTCKSSYPTIKAYIRRPCCIPIKILEFE